MPFSTNNNGHFLRSFSKIDFISWEENQLLAILVENNLGDGSIFTVYNHSWLYLKTDRIPLIKSQFMKDLTFPTYVEKKKVITQVQDIKPRFITFRALESGKISADEILFVHNYKAFLDQYEFKGKFQTPFANLRLWEKKL